MTSLCGQFTTFSKLVICAMMIRGRHRALPYSIDRAIMLPHEEGEGQEEKRES
jgi:Trk-type K+ transport system membrane component